MIIRDLDVICVSVDEPETDPPLIIDRDRELTFSIAIELMESVARRNLKIIELSGVLDIFELSDSPTKNIRRKAFRSSSLVEVPRRPVRERPDHGDNVYCHVTLVKLLGAAP